jgi:uncharacterized membrane protein YhdT
MIARLIDNWRERTDWSAGFWVFAVKFYANPWFAWSWLSSRNDGAATPTWQRVSSTLIGLLHIALAAAIIWLLFRSLDGPLLVTVVVMNFLMIKISSAVVRAQAMYIAFGGERSVKT